MPSMSSDRSDARATAHKQRALGLVFALVAAAAFGGFAATALQLPWQPAHASPAPQAAAGLPTTASLPVAVAGQPLPSLAPMLQRVDRKSVV